MPHVTESNERVVVVGRQSSMKVVDSTKLQVTRIFFEDYSGVTTTLFFASALQHRFQNYGERHRGHLFAG